MAVDDAATPKEVALIISTLQRVVDNGRGLEKSEANKENHGKEQNPASARNAAR